MADEKYDTGNEEDSYEEDKKEVKTRGYEIQKRKLYCGSQNELPDGYDDFGIPSECLRKGVGVGMYIDKKKVAEMLANLFGIKYKELNDYKQVQVLLEKIKRHIKKYVDGKKINVKTFGELLGINNPDKIKIKILQKLQDMKF